MNACFFSFSFVHYWFTGSEHYLLIFLYHHPFNHLICFQTGSRAGDFCGVCYHPEVYHQPSSVSNVVTADNHQPSPSIVSGQLPPATTSIPVPPFPPFSRPAAPLSINSCANLPGVPPNLSMPILQSFEPFQNQHSLTSEDNRRWSMARMNSGRARWKPQQTVIKHHHEAPPSQPIDTDLAVLLLPINVQVVY